MLTSRSSWSTTLLLLALVASVPTARAAVAEPRPDDAARGAEIRARPLGSLSSVLAGRIDGDGVIDTGAVRLRFEDARTGRPLELEGLRFGVAPDLWVQAGARVEGGLVSFYALGMAVARGGDERLVVSAQVEVTRVGDGESPAILARVLPSDDRDARVVPTAAFDATAVHADEDGVITRGGAAVALARARAAPTLELAERVDTPDETIATWRWTPDLSGPGASARLEVHLAGPPAGEVVDERRWRSGLRTRTFRAAFEQSEWETVYVGDIANFEWGDDDLARAAVANLTFLRSLGVFRHAAERLSDRAYGAGSSDAGAEAQIAATFAEWNFGENIDETVFALLADAVARGHDLDADRRLALAHGLVRAVRLRGDDTLVVETARAVEALVVPGARCPPWTDPATVLADLRQLVALARLVDPEATFDDVAGPFEPATVAPGSVAAVMARTRAAISANDGVGARQGLADLLARTTVERLGSLDGDELDGRFAVGLLSLMRETVVDDHGADLRLLPALDGALVRRGSVFGDALLPTHFGRVFVKLYWSGKERVTGEVHPRLVRRPERQLVQMPDGLRAARVRSHQGGTVTPVDETLLEIEQDVTLRPVQFSVTLD